MSSRPVAQATADALADAGTTHVFGMPGGGNNLDVIGACGSRGITFVLAHTETGAAIMATAFGELTDTVGACVVTRGPGAASAVNGAAQAQQDRQPLVLLCDTVDRQSSPRIAHQKIDQRAMFDPVTKWSTTLGALAPDRIMADVVAVARRAPAGAVHVDVDAGYPDREPPPAPQQTRGSLTDARSRLRDARKPVVVVGVGGRPHADAVRRLVQDTNIPVLMTYKAKGVVPDSGPNAAGTFTNADTDEMVLAEADLILTIGLDSIELIPNPWSHTAPVVSLAEYVDPYGYLEPAVSVVGPLGPMLEELPALTDGWPAGYPAAFRDRLCRALTNGPEASFGLTPWDLARLVRAAAPKGSVATVDAGAHMLAVMPLWATESPGEVLISSGLATMGYAVPAAVGAALARPGHRVFCFVGDGGLAMVLGELETIARLGLAVTVIVFNDSALSLIRVKQRPSGQGDESAVRYLDSDFAGVARALGLQAVTVSDTDLLTAALSREVSGPLLLDVRVDPDCYHHVLDVVRFAAVP